MNRPTGAVKRLLKKTTKPKDELGLFNRTFVVPAPYKAGLMKVLEVTD